MFLFLSLTHAVGTVLWASDGFRRMHSLSCNTLEVSGVRAELIGYTGGCGQEQDGSGADSDGCRWV